MKHSSEGCDLYYALHVPNDIINKTLCDKMLMYFFNVSETEKMMG